MISLHYTSHTKAYNTIYTACNIVEAIYSFTHYSAEGNAQVGRGMHKNAHLETKNGKKYEGLPRSLPILHPHIFSEPAAPPFLRLQHSTWPPKPKSWIHPWSRERAFL